VTEERPPNTTRAGGYPLAFLSFWLDQQTTRGNPNQSARPATLQLSPRYGLEIPSQWGRLTLAFLVSFFLWATAHLLKGFKMTTETTTEQTGSEIKVIEIKSLFIECREWFDKVNGNSYFSARIWVNGGQVAILPFQYGYGDQFIYEAQKKLLELGYLPEEPMHRGLWSFAKGLGFDYYTSKANTNKNQMFKLYENYQEEKVTISNKEKN
jgi:hypothetical protein